MFSRWRCALLVMALLACRRNHVLGHLERAKTALYSQQPTVALAEYKLVLDALERDSSAQAGVYRARALRGAADTYYIHLADYKRAVEVYRELIQVCPEAPETLEGRVHLANILQREYRDIRGAIAELTAALARNPPQSAELAYRVATLYFELQDYEQCQIEAANVARRYEASTHVDDALYLRGQALSMMEGRRGEAQRVFSDLLERFPESDLKPHTLVELGRLRADVGEDEKAIELWVEALKTHPDPTPVQHSISKVRQRIRSATPEGVGDRVKAFDRTLHAAKRPAERVMPKTSIEAVGGTPEEAERESKMRAEEAPRHAPSATPPSDAQGPSQASSPDSPPSPGPPAE